MEKSKVGGLTIDTIKKALEEMEIDFGGNLSPKETSNLRHTLGSFCVDGLGEEIYRIPGAGYTNKAGWGMINEELKKLALDGK